jgi:protein TonB
MPEAPVSSPLALAGQGAPAAPAASTRVTSSATVAAPATPAAEPQVGARPDYAYNPPPDYPLALREQGIGGVVWLRVWVDGDGRPGEIRLARGSGYRLLDDAAMLVVRHWRFVPARSGNQTLASWVEFPIRFALSG